MKLLILSDLHLEFEKGLARQYQFKIPEDIEFDVLILAGDIHVGRQAFNFIDELVKQFPDKHIIYVPGNHEYYNNDILTLDKDLKKSCVSRNNPNVNFLNHGEHCIIDNICFIGGTLWTDFQNENPISMILARESMNDYRVIKNMTTKRALEIHKETLKVFEEKLHRFHNYKSVVISHHAPSEKSITEIYKTNKLNGAYYTDLEYLMKQYSPDIWVHGHMHTSFDYMVYDTRVICNPRGYEGYETNPNFEMKVVNI